MPESFDPYSAAEVREIERKSTNKGFVFGVLAGLMLALICVAVSVPILAHQ